MDLIDLIQDSFWTIMPDRLEIINQDLLKNPYQALFRTAEEKGTTYRIENGVAVIPVYGVMQKRSRFFSFFGGTMSTQKLMETFMAAVADESARAIVLDIDSPGGSVGGIEALADQVYNARGIKPVVAFANGNMASGAYWVGEMTVTI